MDFVLYRKAWDNAARETPPIPLNIDIELSAACNLKCPFCFLQEKSYRKITPYFMPTGLARKIICLAKTAGIPAIKLNWRGEATLHPAFNRIADEAGGKFQEVLINTNGNYPADRVYGLAYNFTKIMYSLDSFIPATYARMRPGGDLKTVLRNIEDLISFGHRNIWVRRVLTDSNRGEDFKSAAAQKFGKEVFVSEHHVFDRARAFKPKGKRTYCGYPSQRLVIGTDGGIYPCCVDYGETMKLGNVADYKNRTHQVFGSFIPAIWKGKAIEAIRAKLKTGRSPSHTCFDCRSWMAYDTPEREKVKDIAI